MWEGRGKDGGGGGGGGGPLKTTTLVKGLLLGI